MSTDDTLTLLKELDRRSSILRKRASIWAWASVVLAGAVLAALLSVGSSRVAALEEKQGGLEASVKDANTRLKTAVTAEQVSKKALAERETKLSETERAWRAQQGAISTFLSATLDSEKVMRWGKAVDWDSVRASVASLPSGRRQTAVLIALMVTWRDVRYLDGGTTLAATDGQRFIDLVVVHAGLPPTLPGKPGMPPDSMGNQRASDALLKRFGQPDPKLSPEPGDLMFFDGPSCRAPGSPCCMYLAKGKGTSPGICVGLPVAHPREAAQVIDSGNEQYFPCKFRGYVRVPYEH
jgi:hypothetical protein